jgi:hypothetical protein
MRPATTSSRKERMAESISQADLDALWGSLSEGGNEAPEPAKKEEPAASAGVSQADLDALWADLGGLGEPEPPKEKKSGSGRMSQADLDALWADAPADPTPASSAPADASASAIGENLSQDDIDRLLAEMGK